MTNAKEKSNNSNRNYIILIALVFCAFVYCTVRGCGNDAETEQLYKSTNSTVERIEAEHQQAGSELDAAGGQLNSAGETAGRIDDLINQSQNAGTAITAGIADCKRIVGECQKIIADCKRICAEVDTANSSRTESGSGS